VTDRLRELTGRAVAAVERFRPQTPATAELTEGLRQLPRTAAADPSAALVRVRKALQFVVDAAYEDYFKKPAGTQPLENLLQQLSKEKVFPNMLAAFAGLVRSLGNVGAHTFEQVPLSAVVQALDTLVPVLEWHAERCGPGAAPGDPAVEAVASAAPPPTVRPRRRWAPWVVAGMTGSVMAALAVAGVLIHRGHSTPPDPPVSRPPVARPVVALAPWAQGLPATPVLRLVYGESPPQAPAADRLTVRLDPVFRRKGAAGGWQPLTDGARLSSDDDYRIRVTPDGGGYLYVFQVDTHGKLTVFHPALSGSLRWAGANPVPAGRVVVMPPEPGGPLYLDEELGVEHVYTVLCTARWAGLEAALAQAASAPGSAGAPAVEEPLHLALRGVGGTRPQEDQPAQPAVSEPPVAAHGQEYAADRASALVVERWFRHVAPGP
jgi:hypothetical protein